jgi:SOS-response transcriptional repressor LexA
LGEGFERLEHAFSISPDSENVLSGDSVWGGLRAFVSEVNFYAIVNEAKAGVDAWTITYRERVASFALQEDAARWLKGNSGENGVQARYCKAIIELHTLREEFAEWLIETFRKDNLRIVRPPSPHELYQRKRAQFWVFYLSEISGKSYSSLAEQAQMSKSTVTRFMATANPRYTPRQTTLEALTKAACNDLHHGNTFRCGPEDVDNNFSIIFNDRVETSLRVGSLQTGAENLLSDIMQSLENLADDCDDPYVNLAFQRFAAFSRGEPENVTVQQRDGKTVVPVSDALNSGIASLVNARGASDITVNTAARAELVGEDKSAQVLHVRGQVQAGAFVTALEWDKTDWVRMSLPEDTYGTGSFGLKVKGDSMDLKFPDGSILVCKSFNDEEDELPIDKHVIALNPANGEFEATCKKLVRDKYGSVLLVPESSNPEYKPIPLADLGQDSVTIQAVVIGAIIKF